MVITGRLKDVIIRKGENISAKEVEDLLFTHPKVADAAVIGLPDVAGERGAIVVAIVAVQPDAEPLAFAEMQAFLKEQGLRMQALPERLEHLEEIPAQRVRARSSRTTCATATPS